MSEPVRLDRRTFNAAWAYALLGGAAITISGCGSNSSPTAPESPSTSAPPPPAPATTDKTGDISGNHGHVATIVAADLTAGNMLSLSIRGTAAHNHTVDLTAAEVVSIRGGTRVAKPSSTDNGHSHTVTFN
jgi:hypothetical protein